LKQLLKELSKDVPVDEIDDDTVKELRLLVSKEKRRYQHEGTLNTVFFYRVAGYDLDLSYISPRVIAMGYPSQGYERLFRNPMDSVTSFLNLKHQDHFRVYNLCSEQGMSSL
jgi:hypothetical protein